ncbi:hypothetical protein [Streptomyces flaveolus]|uniref:hypothetical protein n=1 Tax=Streptomyces flaveolus TaxID=67297 RepID=UPI0036FC50C9
MTITMRSYGFTWIDAARKVEQPAAAVRHPVRPAYRHPVGVLGRWMDGSCP